MSRRGPFRVSVQSVLAPAAPALVAPPVWTERPLLSLSVGSPFLAEEDDAPPSWGRLSTSSRSLRDALAAWLNAEL